MLLYSGLSQKFIDDTVHGTIVDRLQEAFFTQMHYYPPESELRAWQNSLKEMVLVLQMRDLTEQGVLIEYSLPQTSKRLDFMLCGHDAEGSAKTAVVELKQWDWADHCEGDDLVITRYGGRPIETLHPSAQVRQYTQFLRDFHTCFNGVVPRASVDGCAYLHNYRLGDGDVLAGPKFEALLATHPMFTSRDAQRLADYLASRTASGGGPEILREVLASEHRPSQKLLDHVAEVVRHEQRFVLLDEQKVVYERVRAMVRGGLDNSKKRVVIVHGGPGTGKSVIAINLMAQLSEDGYNAQYATGSRAFTETLRKITGRRAASQFKYFNNYMDVPADSIDVVISDEAHRIREFSHSRFTPKSARTDEPQAAEIIRAARVPVFLIDDQQAVRKGEIGSSSYLKERATALGCEVAEYRLTAQFRCAGSEAFVAWVDNTLGIQRTAHPIWDGESGFDFRIVQSVQALERLIRACDRVGHTARLSAGFCWPWSKELNEDRTLKKDVVIGDWSMPWNARPEATRLAKGIPKAHFWATHPGGIDQVGCVYTAQGFEYDYAGVIFGKDLVYRFDKGGWQGVRSENADPGLRGKDTPFLELVKSTYRVLLSRGMKGCYVHFMDKETERFVRSRMDKAAIAEAAEDPEDYDT